MSVRDFIRSVDGGVYDFFPEQLDNNWHTIRCEKSGRKLWYIGTESESGFIKFSFGECADKLKKFSWANRNGAMTEGERKEFEDYCLRIKKFKEVHQIELAEKLQEALSNWRQAPDTTAHSAYLDEKGFGRELPPGSICRNDAFVKNILYVPAFDEHGFMWSLQLLFVGKKYFWPGSRAKNTMFQFEGSKEDLIYVGEGIATCFAIWKETKAHVISAFHKDNLDFVVNWLIKTEKIDPKKIVLLADWDGASYIKSGKNPGMLEVQKLCAKYGVNFAYPPGYKTRLEQNWDFADTWKLALGIGGFEVLTPDAILGCVFENPQICTKKSKKEQKPAEKEAKFEEMKQKFEEKALVVKKEPDPRPIELDFGLGKAFPKREKVSIASKETGFFVFELGDLGKPTIKPQYDDLALHMAQELELKSTESFSYLYRDAHYQMAPLLELRKIITSALKKNTDPRDVDRFLRAAQTHNFINTDCLIEPPGFINLANGVLDVRNRGLLEHSPEYFFKYKLRHAYEPLATCPNWQEFLLRTFEGNQALADVSAEIFGYTLLGGFPFLHKAFVLSGEGRNGKSVWLAVLKYMLGSNNCSSVPIQNFDKPFSVVQMDGKLANIMGETTTRELDSGYFKLAVDGEELEAAHKHMKQYSLRVRARQVFACNKLPHLGDATTGAHEKFYILPFQRYIHARERDGNFAPRQLFPEISGIFNWALDGLNRLLQRGMLPNIAEVDAQHVELREELDSVFAWMQEYVSFDFHVENKLQPKSWYGSYRSWCEKEFRPPVQPLHFSKRILAEVRKYPTLRTYKSGNVSTISGKIGLLLDGRKPVTEPDLKF